MASIIDGTTYPGFFKITPDDSAPNVWLIVNKTQIAFSTSDETNGTLSGGGVNLGQTTSSTIDENGNALDTSAKVAEYLSNLR